MKKSLANIKGNKIDFIKLELDHANAIHSYASDPVVKKFIGWPLMKNINETINYVKQLIQREIDGTHFYASVVDTSTEEIIGTVMIFNIDKISNQVEIGYVFHSKTWGKGYCSESVELLTSFCFDVLGSHKIHAQVTNGNIASSKVLEKNGYTLEGQLKDHYYIDNQYYDCLLYGLISK